MPALADDYELHYDADGPALNDVCGLAEDNYAIFWTVGDEGQVFKIVNGQVTDSFTLGGGDYDLHGVSFFPSGDTGYIVGYKRDTPDRWKGIVFRTTSGGVHWDSASPEFPWLGIEIPFLKVQCVPSHYIWVTCGDGYVLWSNDGVNWLPTVKPGGDDDYSYLWGLWSIDSLHGWVASDQSRMIAKTENILVSWSQYCPLPDDSLSYRGVGPFDPTDNPDFGSMSVAASCGEIVSTTDGGTNWSKESYNPYQWWRGTSQNYTGCGSRLCVGTSGTRYDLNDVEQVEIGYNHWNVSVGTNAAIEVDTFNTSPGILEECTIDWLDAVSTDGDSVLIDFTFTNTTDRDSVVSVYLWRSIMQEDFGGDEDAYFYWLEDSFPDWCYVEQDETDTFHVKNYVPTNQTFWYALTTTSDVPNCSASPNVDSARGRGANSSDPLSPSHWIDASDSPDDHGSSLYYHWDTIPHDDTTYVSYAIIRPPTDVSHPYYTGHRGGLITVLEDGISPNRSSYTEGSLVTGEQYHRGVRPYAADRWYGRTSQYFPQDSAIPMDNMKPPMVTGCSARYVPEIDACELWWNPVPDEGSSARPDTFEPNLGGYWVCPYIDGVTDDYHDDHINHPSPLFRTHYVAHMSDGVHGHHWYYSVTAKDRSGNKGDWCPDDSIWIPYLASTSPLATAYNNGTHLARVPGTSNEHVVYESNDEVHYAYSTDGGYEWQNRLTVGAGASPAVATNGSGEPWLVYVQGNTVRYRLRYTSSASGVLFDSQDDSVIPGPPAIALTQSGTPEYAFAAFPVYDLDAGRSSVRVVKFNEDTSVSVIVDTIPNEAMSDSFVSLSLSLGDVVRCCWQRDSAIVYSEAEILPGQWDLIGWSTPHALSGSGTLAKHPFCAASDDSIFAVWSDYDGGVIMRVARDGSAPPDSWSTPESVSTAGEFSDYPQVSTQRVMSWQSLPIGGTWVFRVMVDDSILDPIPPLGSDQCYGHISAQLPIPPDSSPPFVYAAWTEGPMEGGYYEIRSCVYGSGTQEGGMAARSVLVTKTELSSVTPNPFSRTTAIRYQLARQGRAKLTVFDACGRVVRNLVSSEQKPGTYAVTWDGTDNRQRLVPRGIYFVRFDAPDCTGQKKLTLTR